MLGISMDSLQQICGQAKQKGVLIRGEKESLLLPETFKGRFKVTCKLDITRELYPV